MKKFAKDKHIYIYIDMIKSTLFHNTTTSNINMHIYHTVCTMHYNKHKEDYVLPWEGHLIYCLKERYGCQMMVWVVRASCL